MTNQPTPQQQLLKTSSQDAPNKKEGASSPIPSSSPIQTKQSTQEQLKARVLSFTENNMDIAIHILRRWIKESM